MHLVQSPYLHFCVCQINEAVVGRNIVKLNINLNVLTFTNSKFTVDHLNEKKDRLYKEPW